MGPGIHSSHIIQRSGPSQVAATLLGVLGPHQAGQAVADGAVAVIHEAWYWPYGSFLQIAVVAGVVTARLPAARQADRARNTSVTHDGNILVEAADKPPLPAKGIHTAALIRSEIAEQYAPGHGSSLSIGCR